MKAYYLAKQAVEDKLDSNDASNNFLLSENDGEYIINVEESVKMPHIKGSVSLDNNTGRKNIENKTRPVDDDELLKWSTALSFDDYSKDWLTTATSLPSDITYQSLYQGSSSLGSFSGQRSQSSVASLSNVLPSIK